jgi:catechol 2,3-dioxygenase-like lactoylglutathione lyase family enzyme
MPISAARIYHVNTNCRDLARSIEFYRDIIGFTATSNPLPDRPQRGDAFGLDEVLWDGWILQGDLGYAGLSLDLLEWKVPAPGGEPPRSLQEPGFHRLCFVVPDLGETIAAMRAIGATVLCEPVEVTDKAGAVSTRAMVADPDGVPVELCEGTNRHISHVVINCCDLDRSTAYYRDVLGLEPFGTRPLAPAHLAYGLDVPAMVRTARFKDRGSHFAIELVEFVTPAMPPPRERKANDVGLFRMAWSTSDCAGDEAIVRAAGSVPFAPTGELSVGDHLPTLLVLFWPGPDGECLELIEVPSA